MESKAMKMNITGYRGSEYKTVTVEVIREAPQGWIVKHTDGKPAVVIDGSNYSRMSGPRYITIMKDCVVEMV